MPSSRFLAKKMLKSIDFSKAKVIVELGPGDGIITHHILKKINKDTTVICFEINDVFYDNLLKIENPQLKVLKKSAENLEEELQLLGFTEVDYVVSSLPLSIIPKKIALNILKSSKDILVENGMYVQYQYSLSYYKKIKAVFGENVSLSFEALNVPPAFVYKWKKTNK